MNTHTHIYIYSIVLNSSHLRQEHKPCQYEDLLHAEVLVQIVSG